MLLTPTAYQADVCGYVSHDYSTSFTNSEGDETVVVGLPDFVTLDQTDPSFDSLTFAPQNIADYENYNSSNTV
jgi:hypothetical protein